MLMTPFIVKNAASSFEKSSGLHERVLVDEQPRRDDDAERVERAARACRRTSPRRRPRGSTTVSKCSARAMHQRAALAERRRAANAAAGSRSNVDVLQRVEDVEPAAPRRHGERQRDEHPPRLAPAPGHGEIAADRRDRHPDAEHEVATSA